MTVLRSREVLPAVSSKALPLAKENGVLEPETPSKTLEFLSEKSKNTSPSSSSGSEEYETPELGLGSGSSSVVLGTGNGRRRSARLAAKMGAAECPVEVRSGKRKKVERNSLNGEFETMNVEKSILDGPSLRELERVSNVKTMVQQNLVDAGVKDCGIAEKLELGSDVGISGTGIVDNGKRKRNFSLEMKSLGLQFREYNGLEKNCLNLRSGKRVSKESRCDDERRERSEERDISSKEAEGGFRFSRGDKSRLKLRFETTLTSASTPKSDARAAVPFDDSNSDASRLSEGIYLEKVVKDEDFTRIRSDISGKTRLSKEEKQKMKSGDKASSSNERNEADVEVENTSGSSASAAIQSAANVTLQDGVQGRETDGDADDARRAYRDRFRNVARRIASRFAHFSPQQELGNHPPDTSRGDIPQLDADNGREDWPGPFSTAMKIMNDREMNKNGEWQPTTSDKNQAAKLKWVPAKREHHKHQKQLVPSLQELCLSILSSNSDAVSSLECVPDMLRHKISWFLCDRRKMNSHFLELLLHGCPTEIRLRDCSWMSEEQFTKSFDGCITDKLTVLQFDHCGCCLPDYILSSTLARSQNSLPALTTISLRGAYRISDVGLKMLVSSAPFLKSVDLSQCPLLSSDGICSLANSLKSSLRELYLDNCHGIDAMLILPALLNLEKLEVLSLAGIHSVSDDFVSRIVSAHGCWIKELMLADCMELTNSCLKVIGDGCSELRALDLTNVNKLTDVGVGHLANGCREIQSLKFCRSALSDEAISAYLDISGAYLKELSLNNIVKVANNTALSIARNCRNLQSLDLSWCRNLSNEALGLIVDTCTSLELLKLFGCTQVTNVFLDGHSNPQVKLLGLKLTSVFKHIDVPDFLQGPLRYSSHST